VCKPMYHPHFMFSAPFILLPFCRMRQHQAKDGLKDALNARRQSSFVTLAAVFVKVLHFVKCEPY
jgi:hypothetical protein